MKEADREKLTELIRLSKPHLLRQESYTLIPTTIQIFLLQSHNLTVAVPHRCIANTCCKLLRSVRGDLGYGHAVGCSGGTKKIVDGPLPPLECDVVLGELAGGIKGAPGVHLEWDHKVGKDREGEVEPGE